jgi:ectoine hydroxylase-related dioxygenase (phytanoyl-CoA dioxygenase family)
MDAIDLAFYRHQGHLTINGIFGSDEMDAVIRDIEQWGEAFLSELPEGGGPKPAHQDNFYFGPTDIEGIVTAWIALDDSTLANGCLYFGDGTNLGPVYPHFAPEGEPFNLQLPASVLDKQPMAPAPVRKGGVSFHHGNTFHQSGPNHSARWRRACALHYVRNGIEFATPALPYDTALKLEVT